MTTATSSYVEIATKLPPDSVLNYARFVDSLITVIRLRLRMNIRSFGSATMRKEKKEKANEPDACFYVQSAPLIGNRIDVDFATDPPPDIAVEIDIHHDSTDKFSIYAGLGVNEIWRYDGKDLSIHQLQGDHYIDVENSIALAMLSRRTLTHFLNRLPTDGESAVLFAFDEWLRDNAG
jgi:Uma2 family endonuclease